MKYFILCFAVGIIVEALTPGGWGLERVLLLAACITVATIFYESLQNRN